MGQLIYIGHANLCVRHGGSHGWYCNVIAGVREAIPRHAEVSEMLARKIIKHLAAPQVGAR